jgi:DNA-binding LacI/PurR family transcriptional regulator
VATTSRAAQHLLDRGCRRIAFVGDPVLPEVADRHAGYVASLKAAGLKPSSKLLVKVPFDAEQARAGITKLCAQGVPFDAVFACSDVLATAAMQVLHQSGRNVPAEVAVVGYDDIEWASHANPPLTTVRQPIARAGLELVDALLQTIAGNTVSPRKLPVELIVRASSARG